MCATGLRRKKTLGIPIAMPENPYQSPEYVGPPSTAPPPPNDTASIRSAVFFSLFVIQLPVALLSLLMLDGGRMSRACGFAIAMFWIAVLFLLLKRRFKLERSHIRFIRLGFLLFWLVAVLTVG